MGTYTAGEYLELFGGLPEPGEAIPSAEQIDHLRKSQRENGHVLGNRGPSACPACGAPANVPCASGCESRRGT